MNMTRPIMFYQNVPRFEFALREDLVDTGDMFLPKLAEPYATGYDVKAAPANRQDIFCLSD